MTKENIKTVLLDYCGYEIDKIGTIIFFSDLDFIAEMLCNNFNYDRSSKSNCAEIESD